MNLELNEAERIMLVDALRDYRNERLDHAAGLWLRGHLIQSNYATDEANMCAALSTRLGQLREEEGE